MINVNLIKDNMFFGYKEKLTNEQLRVLKSIEDNQLTIINARAGTGKNLLAIGAAKLLGMPLEYVFSPVEENKMGFRKGNQGEKEKAYLGPLYDALESIRENPSQVIYDEENLENAKNGTVWVYPSSHVFWRGSNKIKRTIIIDEAQNFTLHELKKTMTRVHDDCKLIILGHSGQIDLKNPEDSGFEQMIEHFRDEEYCQVCELTVNFRGKLARHADLM